jgi:uncharacterized protein (DUF433 family)
MIEGELMDWQDRIEIRPEVVAGKPVIKGTRLAVEFVVELLGEGWTEQQIVGQYPGLTADDVRACLRYASHVLSSEKVYPASVGQ